MLIGKLIRESARPFFSLEFFPPAREDLLPAFYETADELGKLGPLFVSVTYGAGGARQQNTLAVTASLAKRGFNVMAHLTCVGAKPDAICAFIDDLIANGVDNILALRGDPPKDQDWNWEKGDFRHADDLVRFARRKYPELGIGVALYPAPHPESPTFAEDRKHAAAKLMAGADFGITQLFFDVREYIDLRQSLAAAGIDLPIVPGVLPIQSLESLNRVLSLCGANIPAKLYLDLASAHAEGGAAAVREAGFKFALEQIHALLGCGAPGIHLYTLNKSALCARLIKAAGLC